MTRPRYLYVDCETRPTVDEATILDIAAKVVPPANYTKQETIDSWIADKRPGLVAEAVAKTSFDGSYGHVAAVAYAIDDGDVVSSVAAPIGLSTDHAESTMLAGFFSIVTRTFPNVAPVLVGHNVADFDLRFLWKRAVVLGIPVPAWWPVHERAWDRNRIADTMLLWEGVGGRISQRRLAGILGIEIAPGIDGSEVAQAWDEGRHDEIRAHCAEDVRVVREIHRRLNGVMAVETVEECDAHIAEAVRVSQNGGAGFRPGFRPSVRTGAAA